MAKNYHYKENKGNKKAEAVIYAILGIMVVAIITLVVVMFAKGPTANAAGAGSVIDNSCCESIKIVRSINL